MIAAGYLYKTVAARPGWLQSATVEDVFSVSTCVSPAFTDYVDLWLHNGLWLFDSPEIMRAIASDRGIDLSHSILFYFEMFEQEFDDRARTWSPTPPGELANRVGPPAAAALIGFDVVTFFARSMPECSPLSCNGMADEIETNRHCLFETFEEARRAIETDAFKDCEPGPFRIFAVYTIDDARA